MENPRARIDGATLSTPNTEASMSNLTPVTKCPKCGNTTIEATAFAKAGPHDNLTCPVCGHIASKDQFVADVLDKVAKLAQDAFRDIPGFKRK